MIGSGSQLTIWIWIGIIIFGSVPVSGKIIGPATLLKRLPFYLEFFFFSKFIEPDTLLITTCVWPIVLPKVGLCYAPAATPLPRVWWPAFPDPPRHQRHLSGKVCTEKRGDTRDIWREKRALKNALNLFWGRKFHKWISHKNEFLWTFQNGLWSCDGAAVGTYCTFFIKATRTTFLGVLALHMCFPHRAC